MNKDDSVVLNDLSVDSIEFIKKIATLLSLINLCDCSYCKIFDKIKRNQNIEVDDGLSKEIFDELNNYLMEIKLPLFKCDSVLDKILSIRPTADKSK